MKNTLFSLTFSFCFVIIVSCIATESVKKSRFQLAELGNEDVGFSELMIEATYRLIENEVIALGYDTNMNDGLGGPILCLIDKCANRVAYQSEPYDNSEGWYLHQFMTETSIMILWEHEYEYWTLLPLYVFDLKSKHLAYVGDFDVSWEPGHYAEYTPYPVKDISIEFSDTLVTFKFTDRLHLNPGTKNSQLVDSLIYELNLRTNLLQPTQVWDSDTTN